MILISLSSSQPFSLKHWLYSFTSRCLMSLFSYCSLSLLLLLSQVYFCYQLYHLDVYYTQCNHHSTPSDEMWKLSFTSAADCLMASIWFHIIVCSYSLNYSYRSKYFRSSTTGEHYTIEVGVAHLLLLIHSWWWRLYHWICLFVTFIFAVWKPGRKWWGECDHLLLIMFWLFLIKELSVQLLNLRKITSIGGFSLGPDRHWIFRANADVMEWVSDK